MDKLKVTETFEKNGDTYEEGKTYLAPEDVIEWAEEKGYGSRPGKRSEKKEIPKLEASESEEVWSELKRRAKSDKDKPPDWNPEKGDWLLGTIEKTGEGENNRFAVVEVAEEPVRARQKLKEGRYRRETIRPGGKVLLWEVKDLNGFFDRIHGGSKIAVRYTGTVKTSGGHRAKLYDSAVEE